MKKIKGIIKYLFRPIWLIYCKLSFIFIIKNILPETYISEITFFKRVSTIKYNDIKYIEQQLRYLSHQIDKTLSLTTVNRLPYTVQKIYDILKELDLRGVTDTPTIIWAKQVMEAFKIKMHAQKHTTDDKKQTEYKRLVAISEQAVAELIKTRRSIRSYRKERIAPEIIKQILEVGLYAPSGCNRQNIEFLLLENREDIDFCQKIAGEPYSFPSDSSFAAVVLLDCRSYKLPTERHLAYLETGAAIQNMLLYAHSLNIGSIWLNWGGLESKNSLLRHKYKLPNWLLPTALVCFGYIKCVPVVMPQHKLLQDSLYVAKM
jgi:nitroreductase